LFQVYCWPTSICVLEGRPGVFDAKDTANSFCESESQRWRRHSCDVPFVPSALVVLIENAANDHEGFVAIYAFRVELNRELSGGRSATWPTFLRSTSVRTRMLLQYWQTVCTLLDHWKTIFAPQLGQFETG